MTELQPPADTEPPSPPSCEDLREEAAERPKSLRLLPRITADAVRLVWAASPRMLIASIGLKLLNGAGLAAVLIFGKDLIGSVLSADTGSTTPPGIGAVAPQLALVVGIVAVLGLVTAAGREVREILSETTARHAKQAIIDVAKRVELSRCRKWTDDSHPHKIARARHEADDCRARGTCPNRTVADR